jgi:hypothetical protein
MYYSELLVSSNNKSKTSWNIINSETGKLNTIVHTLSLNYAINLFIKINALRHLIISF